MPGNFPTIVRRDSNETSGNENIFETKGLDIDVSYVTELYSGELYLGFAANILDTYDITGIETGDTQNLAGEVLFPELRFNINASYAVNEFDIYWQLRYWDETKDRNDNTVLSDELNSVDSRVYNDVRVSYNLTENVNAYFGITNLFDEQPPSLTANHKYQQEGTLTNGTAFDLTGRAYYAGIKVNF